MPPRGAPAAIAEGSAADCIDPPVGYSSCGVKRIVVDFCVTLPALPTIHGRERADMPSGHPRLPVPACSRGGFTLTEILIVLVIVAVLSALVYAGVRMAVANARRIDSDGLLRQIVDSLHAYQEDGGFDRPGDAAAMQTEPLRWLVLEPQRRGREPYLLPAAKNLGDASGQRCTEPQADGTLLDSFGKVVRIALTQLPAAPAPGQRCTLGAGSVVSDAGDPGAADDIIWRYDAQSAGGLATWTRFGR